MKNVMNEFDTVPVVILCGGRSVVMGEGSTPTNKALVQINRQPLFWWVVRHYVRYGATQFVMATGYQSDHFADALRNAGAKSSPHDPHCYGISVGHIDCHIRLVPTPQDATTADRLLACKPWLNHVDRFALTYSDTLSDVDLGAEMRFHRSQNLIATLVSARAPMRFRILGIRQGECLVRAFAPRPVIENACINGGYYIFNSAIWDEKYGVVGKVALENQPLENLAKANQLTAFEHKGAWHYCDSERDLATLQSLATLLDNPTN